MKSNVVEPFVINPNEISDSNATKLSVKIEKRKSTKKGKIFATSTDTLKQIIESVNEKEDEVLQVKRHKESENEKYLAERLEKFTAKRDKKKAILDKYKERIKHKQEKKEKMEKQNEIDESKKKNSKKFKK